MKQQVLNIITAALLFLFLYTGISKLAGVTSFKNVIASASLLKPLAGILAIVIPSVEIITAILLFLPATRLTGLFIAALLMLVFTVYIAAMLLFSSNLPCNCGGVLKQLSWPQHLLFNIFFLLLSCAGIRLSYKSSPKNSGPPGHPARAPL